MENTKTCNQCKLEKNLVQDFYLTNGRYRAICKKCTIANSISYQKRTKYWLKRFNDSDQLKEYSRNYYQKNKEKFAKYREKFRENHPNYHREYKIKRKNEIDNIQ